MDTRIPLPGEHKEPSFVPSSIRDEAVSGNYVDLNEFLPQEFFKTRDSSNITMTHNPGTDTIMFHRTMPVQGIETLSDWMRAWNNYERVLMNSDCSLYHELVSYKDLILNCSKKFQWHAVYVYDRRFRAVLGAKQSFSYGLLDHDLYVSVFDQAAVRSDVPRCHRCRSFDHKVAQCPFPRRNPRRRRSRHQHLGAVQQVQASCSPIAADVDLQDHVHPHSSRSTSQGFQDTPHPFNGRATPEYQQSEPLSAVTVFPQYAHCALDSIASSYDTSSILQPNHSSTCNGTTEAAASPPQASSQCLTSSPSSLSQMEALPQCAPSLTSPDFSARPSTRLLYTPVQRLNADAFRRGLQHHEDRAFVDYIITACTEGVDIGYRGPRYYREYDNWPSANTFYEHVQADIDKSLALGIKVGPFSQPPFPNFVGSPMGAFLRKRANKIRTIHDLSWRPGSAINDFISKDDFRITYLTLDEVISSIVDRGRHTQLAKLDLEAAFHHIPVRPQDFELLGSTFHRFNPITNTYIKEYYFDRVLQFGARSSPKLFTDFAKAANLIMHHNGTTYSEQYLDDYVTMGDAGTAECLDNLNIMIRTCKDLGFSLNPSKICQPSTTMEYLGIVLDTDLLQARISSDRLEEVLTELLEWRKRKTATKRQILSLIGKLTFVSRVVRPGRTFVRRMISLASKVPHLHHRISLTPEFHLDVQWWLQYLPQWNGVSLFPSNHWVSNIDLHLFTDSSDLAAAGYFNGAWFIVPFAYEFLELKSMSINWRELFAIVVAADTFGKHWTGKRIMFHCDNMCIVEVIKSGTCRSAQIMDLIRKLFFICAKHDFEVSMCYVNTKDNDIADSLSRLQLDRFKRLAPHADQHMTMPVIMS